MNPVPARRFLTPPLTGDLIHIRISVRNYAADVQLWCQRRIVLSLKVDVLTRNPMPDHGVSGIVTAVSDMDNDSDGLGAQAIVTRQEETKKMVAKKDGVYTLNGRRRSR